MVVKLLEVIPHKHENMLFLLPWESDEVASESFLLLALFPSHSSLMVNRSLHSNSNPLLCLNVQPSAIIPLFSKINHPLPVIPLLHASSKMSHRLMTHPYSNGSIKKLIMSHRLHTMSHRLHVAQISPNPRYLHVHAINTAHMSIYMFLPLVAHNVAFI